MFSGKYAFEAKPGKFYEKIKNNENDMQPLIDSECSEKAKDFIQKCLKKI